MATPICSSHYGMAASRLLYIGSSGNSVANEDCEGRLGDLDIHWNLPTTGSPKPTISQTIP